MIPDEAQMRKQQFPPGWDEKRMRDLLAHYESQTEPEECTDIEAAREAEEIPVDPSSEELKLRRQWFDWYIEHQARNSVRRPPEGGPYRCPCCGCRTLEQRGGSDICPVCFWEDDGQDDQDAEVVRGGPNGSLSLAQARENYRQLGACEERFVPEVRPPLPEELPAHP
jgi:hypothetical protein